MGQASGRGLGPGGRHLSRASWPLLAVKDYNDLVSSLLAWPLASQLITREEEAKDFIDRQRRIRRVGQGRRIYWNGPGKMRDFGIAGTIQVRPSCVRNSEERFEGRFLPLFYRKSKKLGAMLPELFPQNLAKGHFKLALCGLLGDGCLAVFD